MLHQVIRQQPSISVTRAVARYRDPPEAFRYYNRAHRDSQPQQCPPGAKRRCRFRFRIADKRDHEYAPSCTYNVRTFSNN